MLFIQVEAPFPRHEFPGGDLWSVDQLDQFKCWCEPGTTWNAHDEQIECLRWKVSIRDVLIYDMPVQPAIKLLKLPVTA